VSEALASLFPPCVAVEAAGAVDADESSLTPEETRWLAPMAPGRRREFTMGRNAARRALARLGLAPVTIGRHADDRDPQWPEGIVGSISHTQGIVIAACARSTDAAAIGLDVETAGPLGEEIVNEICRDEELDVLRGLTPPSPSDWPKVVFVIKEASYKAWFPHARTALGFHAMHVTIAPAIRHFSAQILPAERAGGLAGPWRAEGRFLCTAEFVMAGALVRPRP
jgi:4'-phosphopantetheinyl transferase EntD